MLERQLMIFHPIDFCVDIFLDTIFSLCTPKQRREAVRLYRASKRYVNYKRDILAPEKLAELEADLQIARTGLHRFDRDAYVPAVKRLEAKITQLPGLSGNALAENVEIFFVLFAIFFGLKTFIAQPFRIPTGSMQPSLNGIRAIPYDSEPGLLGKAQDMLLYGSSYVHEIAQSDMRVVGFDQGTKFLLFTRTKVFFKDQFENEKSIELPAAEGEVRRYFKSTRGSETPSFHAGQTIVKARFDAGDLILVDRMSYHFRKPKAGEVFVFDTVGIEGIAQNTRAQLSLNHQNGGMADQMAVGTTHYVKRLCALPGDTVTIQSPHLVVNGKFPKAWTIQRVVAAKPPYNRQGYIPCVSDAPVRQLPRIHRLQDREKVSVIREIEPQYFLPAGRTQKLAYRPQEPWLNEYLALGDNTTNSFDSRYWGSVKQYNLIGTATFVLWPFTDHWGVIP